MVEGLKNKTGWSNFFYKKGEYFGEHKKKQTKKQNQLLNYMAFRACKL